MDEAIYKAKCHKLLHAISPLLKEEELNVCYGTLCVLITRLISITDDPEECLKDFIKIMTETIQEMNNG